MGAGEASRSHLKAETSLMARTCPPRPPPLIRRATPEVRARLVALGSDTLVLFGIEAHVCVLQTALDFLRDGKTVYLVVDGVSSQRLGDRAIAIRAMETAGARLTTTESLIFLLLDTAEHPSFKAVQKHVIEFSKAPSELDHMDGRR